MCVCVCVRVSESLSVCLSALKCVSVWVRVIQSNCVSIMKVCVKNRVCVCMCVCVCVRETERDECGSTCVRVFPCF